MKHLCRNAQETRWLQCELCEQWYHCLCVGISYAEARKNRSFVVQYMKFDDENNTVKTFSNVMKKNISSYY